MAMVNILQKSAPTYIYIYILYILLDIELNVNGLKIYAV